MDANSAGRRFRPTSFCTRSAARMAIVWETQVFAKGAARNCANLHDISERRRKFAIMRSQGIIEKDKRGGLSQCPRVGTSPNHVRLAGRSNKTRRTDDTEEIRNCRGYGVARCARGGADQLSAFHDYVILEGRSSDVYAEPVQPGFILPREVSSITACLPNMV